MMKYFDIYIIVLISFMSCNSIPDEIEEVLKMSGDNRQELQAVIDYYQAPKDSLKLKATFFLLKNEIPIGTYIDIQKDNQIVKEIFLTLSDSLSPYFGIEDADNFHERYQIVSKIFNQQESISGELNEFGYQVKSDLKNISAKFLIENIEYAFKAWDLPWAKKYTFQQFCNYILPYRSGRQYPNAWRKFFFNELKPFRDSIGNITDAVLVSAKLNSYIENKDFIGSGFIYNAPNVLSTPEAYKLKLYGNCVSMSNLVSDMMRSMGIPTTDILMNKFGHNGKDHLQNAVLASNGDWKYFNIGNKPDTLIYDGKLTKIYRKIPSYFGDLTRDEREILKKINLFGWKDITNKLTDAYNVKVPLTSIGTVKKRIAYLCIFNSNVNQTWVPIDWTLIDQDKKEVTFKDIGGKEVVYLAMVDDGINGLKSISDPFILRSNGLVDYIKPKKEMTTIRLKRKNPPVPHLEEKAKALTGGIFEASNSPDFKNSKILHRIKDTLNTNNIIVSIKNKAFRYYRFLYPKIKEGFYYDMAELGFGTKKGNRFVPVKGRTIASEGLNKKITDRFFDSDLLTFSSIYKKKGVLKSYIYETKESFLDFSENVWVGLDLGIPKQISQISFCPRTDKNGIYPDMQYELFYWANEWISVGIKKANGMSLLYENVPKGALFWLKNHTEGKEERIFTYKNGEQVWW
ncbi:hypothetical protein [Flavivirga spongiicola]|uniref:Peptide-N(4)-(N-acetyl-beta-glucosaminyl)asparagine amidase n=1 Tax=Flavivirga spongiicola TaxID=421621 RepID=A0ABU7XMB9_9FLAO|nr:hypothetical protein [Flavivirga sp. MEBiC05379]MDO5981568.1 hypothetical protein [Flavivirga sp. MEBiC05379]